MECVRVPFIPFFTRDVLNSATTVEIIGYAARAVSHQQAPNPTIAPYVISTLLVLIAPALLAASIYMFLGRVIVGVDAEAHSLIRTRWLTKVFVTSDVVTFLIQLAGTLCPFVPLYYIALNGEVVDIYANTVPRSCRWWFDG